MKFLIDMALSPKTDGFLNSVGHEAVRVDSVGMARAKDSEIIEYAIKHNMILITSDLGVGQILAFTMSKRPSIIILRLKNPSPDHVNSVLSSALSQVEDALKKGSIIIIVEDKRIRIRELPI
jgi:predicted nuclease of predicted toxin-antitoxin system